MLVKEKENDGKNDENRKTKNESVGTENDADSAHIRNVQGKHGLQILACHWLDHLSPGDR